MDVIYDEFWFTREKTVNIIYTTKAIVSHILCKIENKCSFEIIISFYFKNIFNSQK